MEEREPKKHENFIEPGSKEDKELTEALHNALDEADRQNKERNRRRKETEEKERKRRAVEGLPLGDDCFFVRLTGGMHVRDEDREALWAEDRVAIHLTGGSPSSESLDAENFNPKDYPVEEKMIASALRLSEKGGYVWLEDRSGREAKVGVVRPGTRIEDFEARWAKTYNPKYKEKAGTEATLKTLPLEKVRKLGADEAMMLRASRPVMPDHVGRNLRMWRPDCGTSTLISMIDKAENETSEARWNGLPPDLQTMVCADFLRCHDNPNYPKLKCLLLPPATAGREADIYGLTEGGAEVIAQVPFRQNREREGHEAGKKIRELQKYRDSGKVLVCFVPGFRSDETDAGQGPKLFEDDSPVVREGVLLIPIQEVFDWAEGQPAYAEKLFAT